MLSNFLIAALGVSLQGVNADAGWCRASPQAGLPDYARCLPADQAMARYVIEVAPVVAFGLDLKYAKLPTHAHWRYSLASLEAMLR